MNNQIVENDLMKRCSRCGIISLNFTFFKNKTKNDGSTQHCTLCQKIVTKKIIMNIMIYRILYVENTVLIIKKKQMIIIKRKENHI